MSSTARRSILLFTIIAMSLPATCEAAKSCSKCDANVGNHYHAGDECPSCGVVWSSETGGGGRSALARYAEYMADCVNVKYQWIFIAILSGVIVIVIGARLHAACNPPTSTARQKAMQEIL